MKKNSIKKKPLIFLVLIGIVGLYASTFAFYTSSDSFANNFKVSTYNVSIDEEFYNKWGTKKVKFVNYDNTPVVIRFSIDETWTKNTGDEKLTLDNNYNGENVVIKDWTDDFKNDFIDGHDGYYYYKKVLEPNSSVQVLNSINLNEDLIKNSPYYDSYNSYDYNLSFNLEAIQATSDAISSIWNKNTTINLDDVTWN